jgi:short-chain fatty acids transporter
MAEMEQRSGLDFLKEWGAGLTRWTEKYIPDALVIVWILTIITFIMALIWGDVGLSKAVQAWGNGFWALLAFAMQMCLIMMTGYILACSPPANCS